MIANFIFMIEIEGFGLMYDITYFSEKTYISHNSLHLESSNVLLCAAGSQN